MKENVISFVKHAVCFMDDTSFAVVLHGCDLCDEVKKEIENYRNACKNLESEILEKYGNELTNYASSYNVFHQVIVAKTLSFKDIDEFIVMLKGIITETEYLYLIHKLNNHLKAIEKSRSEFDDMYKHIMNSYLGNK